MIHDNNFFRDRLLGLKKDLIAQPSALGKQDPEFESRAGLAIALIKYDESDIIENQINLINFLQYLYDIDSKR